MIRSRFVPAVLGALRVALAAGVLSAGAGNDHQVPAGTKMFIELRTPLVSDGSQAQDPIRGVLKSAISIDGVELVPAGAAVLGTVVEASPALRKGGLARLAIRFTVLEHPQTGSRVPIRTAILTFAADAGKKKKGADGAAAFNQVRLDAGADVSASLLEPFIVRIPRGLMNSPH